MTAIRAAAVQISPVLYSREGTVEKVVEKIIELGRQGVQFATFSEEIRSDEDASGHRRSARIAGMAERTPKALASYEAAQTTERLPRQVTMTGLPRSCGSSRCSTEA